MTTSTKRLISALAFSVVVGVGVLETPQLSQVVKNIVQPKQGTESIEKAVQKSVKLAGAPTSNQFFNEIKRLDAKKDWAFGVINVYDSAQDEHWTRLWVAKKTNSGWLAEVDFTPDFFNLVKQAPETVINQQEKVSFNQSSVGFSNKPLALAGDNSALLSLPWSTGQSWNYNSGPHARASGNDRSALDLAGGDQQVKSARDGIAYTNCYGSQVYIRHADGWQTNYYHLQSTQSFNGTSVGRGAFLGYTGTTTGCGGSTTGRHVHFSLQRNGVAQSWHGRDIGGWTIYNGSTPYNGSAVKNGQTVYANAVAGRALLYNDGSYGTTPPTSGLKTYFIGSYALNTNNNFVRIDGFPIMSSWTRNDNDPDQQFERLQGNWGTLLKHKSTGGCLNAHYLSNNARMNVWSPCNASDPDQNWTIADLGNGYFHIKRANTNFCVDMADRTNGGRILLWPCDPNNANQRWRTN